ncbi:MAG TPA: hypothetical protein PK110_09105 [Niabella sp.]|nr:hypothetical protein [Chitinophagaceae bacterium]HRN47893.1 hypothetical protein [Niabella sp.]HRO84964.1 hypothetical protein [Niabella sp.]HUN04490.1 hypothetical protein [Niabella sp.]
MKTFLTIVFLSFIVLSNSSASKPENEFPKNNFPEGAWHIINESVEHTMVAADGFCMITQYDRVNKLFAHTWGGNCHFDNSKLVIDIKFDSYDKSNVGKTKTFVFHRKKDGKFITDLNGKEMVWTQVDEGNKNLAGNWRITQRRQDGKMVDIPLRARRTLKLLSATRFQWAAINIETGEFSGTGGGTYTFKDGKYTENIEFFSRDNSRVGASLSFDARLENGNWIHSGLSSKGDPIYEVWSRMKE